MLTRIITKRQGQLLITAINSLPFYISIGENVILNEVAYQATQLKYCGTAVELLLNAFVLNAIALYFNVTKDQKSRCSQLKRATLCVWPAF